MIFTNGVVPCAREKTLLEVDLEKWMEALERVREERNESVKNKDRVHAP